MLRSIVGDLRPGGFARCVDAAFGAYTWVIIETAKRNSEFRGSIRGDLQSVNHKYCKTRDEIQLRTQSI